jgi:hypothetical protein
VRVTIATYGRVVNALATQDAQGPPQKPVREYLHVKKHIMALRGP